MSETGPIKLITQEQSWNEAASKHAIDMLEEWLAMAKSGEVVAVALAGETADGMSISAFTRPRSRATMIGSLAHMQYRLHIDMET